MELITIKLLICILIKCKSYYQDSDLFAENAEYSNSENFLSISDKVKLKI